MKSYISFLFLLLLSVAYSQNNKRDIDSIKNIIKNSTNKETITREKAGLVIKYFTSGEQKKAGDLYKEALSEAIINHSESGLAALYHTKGNLFSYESKFDSALSYFKKALKIRKKIGDDVGILKSMGNIGSIYFMLADYKTALGYYEETLKKEAELKFEEGKYFSINNLGYIYSRLKISNKALAYFKKAEKIYAQSPGQLIFTYDGMSNVYKDLGNSDSALYFAFKTRDISATLNEQNSLSYALVNIATIYMEQEKFGPAKEYLEKALELTSVLKDDRLELAVLGNFVAIEVETNHPEKALSYMDRIVFLQKELNIKTDNEDLTRLFAEYYYKKGDFQKAYDYMKIYEKYTDSLYRIETTKQITEMQEKYETEKKEKENKLLQIENTSYKTTRNYLLLILAIAITGIIGAFIAYRKIKHSKELLAIQKQIVDEKQKEIIDSINYARRIQFALLASDNILNTYLPQHFVLFKPKAVVSGDFYWATATPEGFIYITADCTGHGVPGAFMSLLNISKLSQIINENKVYRPDQVLNNTRSEIIKALNPEGSDAEGKDGMDAVICLLNLKAMRLEFAAANNSFYIIRDNKILTCKADKMPVGKGHDDSVSFTYNEIALKKDDIIYTFTDGFADQFGGAAGKKFKYKRLEEFLLSIYHEPLSAQKEKLNTIFESWKGSLEQVDDVCIIGVKI
jgi:serine phosphatase RsbU (regulator of sigma subunit)/Tfp pilus assembly protein PilF